MIESGNFPKRVTIETTNRCNLNCSFCPRQLFDMPLGDMTPTLYYKIIDECSQHLPITVVIFFRGEPLLAKDLPAFVEYAKEKGITTIQMATNCMLLDEKTGEDLLVAGLDFISFSLDTNDNELYKEGREHGNLDISRENALKFIETKNRLGSNCEIQVSTVDIEKYRHKQKEFIDFWIQYADRVRVYVEHSSDGNFGSVSDSDGIPDIERLPCKKVFEDIIIYFNGQTAICNHDWNNQMSIGNTGEDTIFSIWNSEKYDELRRLHEQNNFCEGFICKTCEHWKMAYLEDSKISKVYTKLETEDL